MNTRRLLLKLSKKFPKKLAKKHHDYVGLMCGTLKEDVKRIFLCLDFDDTIYDQMLEAKPDLIITHHPFIYGQKSKVLKYDLRKKELVDKLLADNIPVYSFHTNFDEGKDGMNDALARKAGLKNIRQLEVEPMARGGELPYPMTMEELTKYLCDKFDVSYGICMNYGAKTIKNMAIIGGGGWYMYEKVALEGYDCYVSGDIPHHGRRGVVTGKFNYIDLPHEIENIFMEQMKKVLLEIDESLEIVTITHEKSPQIIMN